ncbi:transporter substrate-binding domain-containing protein [Fulvivirga sp. RKSG066]|uniref:substrate-binding periplasmic protein n=1 Tax=Fulvivirga aurantia TaxID=2529383 RepID=UPI0012BD3730|nr:transporter substrate-binding domain-containing protein [Fulvivirga aurantia]MTI23256.1 transporter substrate-binding domain-containing protein [Fulvivirga aurantia]
MKIKIFLTLCLALVVSTLSAQLTGSTYASAKSSGSATWVITYSEAPGFASSNKSGITFDIMRDFEEWVENGKKINVTVKYEVKDAKNFTSFLETVKKSKGGVFGLSNTTITDARKKVYNFSPPYITNIGMIVTNSEVKTMVDLSNIANDFAGMTAVTVRQSTNEKRLLDLKAKYYPGMKVEYVPSFQEAIDRVVNDPTKFTNVDFTYYIDGIQNRKPLKRHAVGDDPTEQFGIIMPQSNDWAPLLAEFMEGYTVTTEYKKIIMKNLGPSAMKFFETLK